MLFDGEGALIGLQDKLYLSDLERKMGVSPGEQVAVFDSPVGRIALLTAQDALSFEPFWLAKALGADRVIAGADPFGRAPMPPLPAKNRLCIVGPGIVVDQSPCATVCPPLSKRPLPPRERDDL